MKLRTIFFLAALAVICAGAVWPAAAHAEDFTLRVPVKLISMPPECPPLNLYALIIAEDKKTAIAQTSVPVPMVNGSYSGTVTIKMNASNPALKYLAAYYFVVLTAGTPAETDYAIFADLSKPHVIVAKGSLSGLVIPTLKLEANLPKGSFIVQ